MTTEQMQNIIEFIPTPEEKKSLHKYITTSEDNPAEAFGQLCECEKFMVAMMTVKNCKEKIRALLFKLQFKQCIEDLVSGKSTELGCVNVEIAFTITDLFMVSTIIN